MALCNVPLNLLNVLLLVIFAHFGFVDGYCAFFLNGEGYAQARLRSIENSPQAILRAHPHMKILSYEPKEAPNTVGYMTQTLVYAVWCGLFVHRFGTRLSTCAIPLCFIHKIISAWKHAQEANLV